MHFHLPKPLHGWRAFAGEVGIIVLGVLIALGAERLVSSFTWSMDVRDFRAAVDTELEFDLAASEYRVQQTPCLQRRLAELDRWSAAQHAGQEVPLLRDIGYPKRVSPGTSVWDSRGADLTSHVPIQARLAYSDFYDLIANQWDLLQGERQTWLSLNGFNHATKLSPDDLIRLDELIYRAKTFNRFILGDQSDFAPDVRSLGLHASFGRLAPTITPFDPDFCKPILRSESGRES
jgi:hypothetical protein